MHTVVRKKEIIPLIKKLLSQYQHPSKMLQIIEAGAFNGTDTLRLASAFPTEATIHAFEPVPDAFALLEKATEKQNNVKIYQQALSSETSVQTFYLSEKPTKPGRVFKAGSLLPPKERMEWSSVTFDKQIDVDTISLNDWCALHHQTSLDMLWLDMQGTELAVLQATTPSLLSTIRVVAMEVNFIEAYKGCPLYEDVVTWMNQAGFALVATDFTTPKDTWYFGNCIFAKKTL